ncbi:MAG: hypothetical protein LQ344_006352 [Seirophora lacunosa]|nr:MAG: hypothetical protein LQ344_006352 [Seirophora lacunosa]
MSDDDDDFMQESDNEEYEFEYEDDDDEEGGNVGIENKYYNAKQMKIDNLDEAIVEFLGIPAMESEKGDWGFKGLKQAIKLEFKLRRYDQAVEHYRELLTYVKSAVTRNYSEKSINNMLDFIEKGSDDEKAYHCMEKFYSLTLESFQSTNNERLWLKTNIKLARLWLDRRQYTELVKKVRDLLKACQREDGTDDPSKGTYALEIYALEIQMYAETRNNKRLKNWKEAQLDFNESFRNYDEAGSLQRIQVLKYLVLTTMLMKSEINPFDSQETKPYENDPRISAMTKLVDAYQHDDIHRYESVLQNNKEVLADPFIAENIDEVTRNMRTKGVLKLIAPYTRFNMAFIAEQLKISVAEVQDIVGFLIVDGKLKGQINQERGTVDVESREDIGRTHSMQQWTSAIDSLWRTILDEGDGFKADESQALGASGFSGMPPPRLEGMALPGLQRGMNGGGKKVSGKKGGLRSAAAFK